MVIFLKGTEKNWDIVDCFGGFHPRKCHRSCPFSTLLWTSPSVELDGAGWGGWGLGGQGTQEEGGLWVGKGPSLERWYQKSMLTAQEMHTKCGVGSR